MVENHQPRPGSVLWRPPTAPQIGVFQLCSTIRPMKKGPLVVWGIYPDAPCMVYLPKFWLILW